MNRKGLYGLALASTVVAGYFWLREPTPEIGDSCRIVSARETEYNDFQNKIPNTIRSGRYFSRDKARCFFEDNNELFSKREGKEGLYFTDHFTDNITVTIPLPKGETRPPMRSRMNFIKPKGFIDVMIDIYKEYKSKLETMSQQKPATHPNNGSEQGK